MKISKYNILKRDNGRYYILNTLNSTFLEISENDYMKIQNECDMDIIDSKTQKELATKKMLVADSINELKELKDRYLKMQTGKDLLTITIAPTLRCNFKCDYCYENRNGKLLSPEKQKKILNFIEMQLSTGYKKLDLIWFGGEPLMAYHIIKNMSLKIIDLCEKYGVDYSGFMTTNGYFLNEDIISSLNDLKIKQLYVTLDGVDEVHNKRRCLLNGNGTFEDIIKNLHIAKKYDTNVIIRMNIDENNTNSIEELRKYISDNLQFPMYLGLVRQYTDSCHSNDIRYLTKEQYASIQDVFEENQAKDGLLEYKFPRQLDIYCRACKVGTFVIDPDLNIFKCENDIGRPENKIATIDTYPYDSEIDGSYNKKFYEWNPFEFEKCQNCNILPICTGGCPFVGIKDNNPECEIYKYNSDNFVKKYVLNFGSKS